METFTQVCHTSCVDVRHLQCRGAKLEVLFVVTATCHGDMDEEQKSTDNLISFLID